MADRQSGRTAILPLAELPPPTAGFVSPRCRFADQEGTRFVLLDGVLAFRYHLSDRTEERLTWSTVHIDGQVTVYHGQARVGETWSGRCRKVVKGQTANWANLPGGMPLLAIQSEFNEGLSRVLPEVVAEVRRVLPEGTGLLLAFDRGGHSALTFERLLALGCGLLTYRRDPGSPLPDSLFQACPTRIGPRLYDHAPHERPIRLPVHETVDRGPGRKPRRRPTGRTVALRQIRIRRQDGGQTVILAGGTDLPATDLAAILFARIGSQENTFKYPPRPATASPASRAACSPPCWPPPPGHSKPDSPT